MFGSIRLKACAKINLCLDIIRIRKDGYHLIESIMQSLELHDTVSVRRRGDGKIRVFCPGCDIPEKSNVAYKAAKVFFEATDLSASAGATIYIKKRIPSQAGLGGGSADAAAVLVALNRLYKTGISEDKLSLLGAKVGADVPFCVCGGARLCRGIGEILTKLDDLNDCYIVLVKGYDGVSTKQAYEDYDNASDLVCLRLEKVVEAISAGNFEALRGKLINVFEESTSVKEVSILVNALRKAGAVEAAMTGSGSAVFGIFTDRKAAKKCAKELKKQYPFSCVTRPSVRGVYRF